MYHSVVDKPIFKPRKDGLTPTELYRIVKGISGEKNVDFIPSDHWAYDATLNAILYNQASLLDMSAIEASGLVYQKTGFALFSNSKKSPWDYIERTIRTIDRKMGKDLIAPRSVMAIIRAVEEERVENLQRDEYPGLEDYSLPPRWKGYRRPYFEQDLAKVAEVMPIGTMHDSTGIPDYWLRVAIASKGVAAGGMTIEQLPDDMPWDLDLFEQIQTLGAKATMDEMMQAISSIVPRLVAARIDHEEPPQSGGGSGEQDQQQNSSQPSQGQPQSGAQSGQQQKSQQTGANAAQPPMPAAQTQDGQSETGQPDSGQNQPSQGAGEDCESGGTSAAQDQPSNRPGPNGLGNHAAQGESQSDSSSSPSGSPSGASGSQTGQGSEQKNGDQNPSPQSGDQQGQRQPQPGSSGQQAPQPAGGNGYLDLDENGNGSGNDAGPEGHSPNGQSPNGEAPADANQTPNGEKDSQSGAQGQGGEQSAQSQADPQQNDAGLPSGVQGKDPNAQGNASGENAQNDTAQNASKTGDPKRDMSDELRTKLEEETRATAEEDKANQPDFTAESGSKVGQDSESSLEDAKNNPGGFEGGDSDDRRQRYEENRILPTWPGILSTALPILGQIRKAIMRHFLENEIGEKERGLRRGRIDMKAAISNRMAKLDRDTVYTKRVAKDEREYAVYLLVDVSGSMDAAVDGAVCDPTVFGLFEGNARWMLASRFTVALTEMLSKCRGVKVGIGVHDHAFMHLKDFDQRLDIPTKDFVVQQIGGFGGTSAQHAYTEIAKQFKEVHADRKLLIHLTDGAFAGECTTAFNKLKKMDVDMVVLTVGIEADFARRFVPDDHADEINDTSIGPVLNRHFKRMIERSRKRLKAA